MPATTTATRIQHLTRGGGLNHVRGNSNRRSTNSWVRHANARLLLLSCHTPSRPGAVLDGRMPSWDHDVPSRSCWSIGRVRCRLDKHAGRLSTAGDGGKRLLLLREPPYRRHVLRRILHGRSSCRSVWTRGCEVRGNMAVADGGNWSNRLICRLLLVLLIVPKGLRHATCLRPGRLGLW